ncbi:MAG: hypothetical protein ACLVJ6_09365 [Merdibacter sp.]
MQRYFRFRTISVTSLDALNGGELVNHAVDLTLVTATPAERKEAHDRLLPSVDASYAQRLCHELAGGRRDRLAVSIWTFNLIIYALANRCCYRPIIKFFQRKNAKTAIHTEGQASNGLLGTADDEVLCNFVVDVAALGELVDDALSASPVQPEGRATTGARGQSA